MSSTAPLNLLLSLVRPLNQRCGALVRVARHGLDPAAEKRNDLAHRSALVDPYDLPLSIRRWRNCCYNRARSYLRVIPDGEGRCRRC